MSDFRPDLAITDFFEFCNMTKFLFLLFLEMLTSEVGLGLNKLKSDRQVHGVARTI